MKCFGPLYFGSPSITTGEICMEIQLDWSDWTHLWRGGDGRPLRPLRCWPPAFPIDDRSVKWQQKKKMVPRRTESVHTSQNDESRCTAHVAPTIDRQPGEPTNQFGVDRGKKTCCFSVNQRLRIAHDERQGTDVVVGTPPVFQTGGRGFGHWNRNRFRGPGDNNTRAHTETGKAGRENERRRGASKGAGPGKGRHREKGRHQGGDQSASAASSPGRGTR